MCCDETGKFELPPQVIETLAHYRRLLQERGRDWGDERVDWFRWIRFSLFGPILDQFAILRDWPAAVRAVIGPDVPPGVVVIRVDKGRELHADTGPARAAIAGRPRTIDVVVDSDADADVELTVAGRAVHVAPGGAAVEAVGVDGDDPRIAVRLGDQILQVEGALRTLARAELQLSSPQCARWSVTDSTGGAWFPEGALPKWDFHHRPFFYGHDVILAVPATALRIICTRGLEFDRTEMDVEPVAGETTVVACDPVRLFDPAADGWYGGDLHIHMNYSGDFVCTPSDAVQMQLGEGLHLANFVAANCQTSLVYDRQMLESYPDTDLPWSRNDTVARMGVEYRNDLFGHVHALGPSAPPARYYAGHERSDQPEDWPPNKLACEELQQLGATVGYAHPALTPFPDDWSTDQFFEVPRLVVFPTPRQIEARELVADAALGVVDSVDVISPTNDDGAMFLYHRLLSCGLRLAATAGTDVFLSFSHGPGVLSNPPGWGRVYAQLGDQPLSVASFKDAIRAGRTIVTNGPWLMIEVNRHGPGAVLDVAKGAVLDIRAWVQGPGVDRLTIVGPDGIIAEQKSARELRAKVSVDAPTWIAAAARGRGHPRTLDATVFAHTSPVYVDIAGQRVARAADARWCLDFLDTLERFVDEHGAFHPAARTAQFGTFVAVLDQARSFYGQVARSAQR